MDKTIIYYSSNMETPEFEAKVVENLKKQAGDIPIISVTRKPMDLGKNFCVGERPVCYSNSFRQLLIGLKLAKTKYCISAESDCLYPPEYFTFTPRRDDVAYRYGNVYVYFDGHRGLWRKQYTEAAQMANTDYWISQIERVLGGHDSWEPLPNKGLDLIFTTGDKYTWVGDNPVLYFKTRRGVGYKTGFIPGAVFELPYWGTYDKIRKDYL